MNLKLRENCDQLAIQNQKELVNRIYYAYSLTVKLSKRLFKTTKCSPLIIK